MENLDHVQLESQNVPRPSHWDRDKRQQTACHGKLWKHFAQHLFQIASLCTCPYRHPTRRNIATLPRRSMLIMLFPTHELSSLQTEFLSSRFEPQPSLWPFKATISKRSWKTWENVHRSTLDFVKKKLSFKPGPPMAAKTTSCDSRALSALSKAACVAWVEQIMTCISHHQRTGKGHLCKGIGYRHAGSRLEVLSSSAWNHII